MVRYRESLTPSLPLHVALLVLLPMGFGMVAPLSLAGGAITAVAVYGLALLFLVGQAPKLIVTEATFRAGRATIDRQFLGSATVVDKDSRTDSIADARTWKVLRAWIPGGVLVTVNDPSDPTPSWYVSSRNPEALAKALNES